MKYLLMMNTPRGTGDYQINNWSPEDFQHHIAFMHRYITELLEKMSGSPMVTLNKAVAVAMVSVSHAG